MSILFFPQMITQKRASELLQSFGHKYNRESLQQSELRVLKTLNWNVMLTTPLIYVDALLQILGELTDWFSQF